MKRFATIILVFAFSLNANCEYAIVKDKDGFVNVRESQSISSKIFGTIKDGEIIDVFAANDEPTDVWYGVSFLVPKSKVDTNKDEWAGYKIGTDSIWVTGYVHKSRLKLVSEMDEFKGHYRSSKEYFSFTNDSINLKIMFEPFKLAEHKIIRDQYGDFKLIDGQEPLGVINLIPEYFIKKVELTINGESVKIKKQLYRNMYEIDQSYIRLRIFNGDIYLDMPHNSDGGGSWEALWVIRNGKIIKSMSEGMC